MKEGEERRGKTVKICTGDVGVVCQLFAGAQPAIAPSSDVRDFEKVRSDDFQPGIINIFVQMLNLDKE